MTSYINLIRKITWTFYHTSGIEWEELFSEACLAYYEALSTYDSAKKSKESSWIYLHVKNHLINFCKKECRNRNLINIEDWYFLKSKDPDYEFFKTLPKVSQDVKLIIEMVLNNPSRYNSSEFNDRKSIGFIRHDLREKLNWKFARINNGMRSLRSELLN
jgi:DNA-directed RNA polymerase specialized sigma24 family protein